LGKGDQHTQQVWDSFSGVGRSGDQRDGVSQIVILPIQARVEPLLHELSDSALNPDVMSDTERRKREERPVIEFLDAVLILVLEGGAD
jgi:hypothetical protein